MASLSESHQLMQYISDAIGTIREPQELFRTLTDKLRLIFEFDSAVIITFDRDRHYVNVFFEMLRFEVPDSIQRKKRPVAGSWIEPHLGDSGVSVLAIEDAIDRYPSDFPVPRMLYDIGMRQVVLSPLRSGGKVIGFLNFVSKQLKNWSEDEKELLATLSFPIAVAVSNAAAYEELRQREAQTAMQLAVNNALLTIKDRNRMMQAVCEQINKLVPCAFVGIRVFGEDGKPRVFDNYMRDSEERFSPASAAILHDALGFGVTMKESFSLISLPGVYSGDDFTRLCGNFRLVDLVREKFGICSVIVVRLWDIAGSSAGLIISDTGRSFGEEDLTTVNLIVPQLSLALQNFLAFEKIDELLQKLEGEKIYLAEEIKAAHNFEEIIGQSDALMKVLRRVSQVAPTDATVLVEGETGTGKELIARALHNLSSRRERMLVKVNCAALPASLIETELFGHEKGSFTGATERRAGKFELANGGTIFLDEIGELPLELQAKMLRVLQEKELERIGGKQVIPVDVRVITATNRNLEKEVADGKFREDLYFRLNAFPITLPPLRERREDIPMLVRHFVDKFSREFGKTPLPVRETDMLELQARNWKGNIRELAHSIEQAVILSEGATLDFSSVPMPQAGFPAERRVELATLEDFDLQVRAMERGLILDALGRAGGRVSGKGGAAELLRINPKTLYSRIDKLGIRKNYG
ncbi:MAG: sigma 54-interacting transcriptional regulator [Chlorobiaceae bacterium]|nr:sigma 54-interacting transcriptional regulator [Chlorobiaceae bacterium]